MEEAVARYRIQEIADELGWTVPMLAKRANLDPRRLQLIADNKAGNVTVGTLERVAATARRPLRAVFEEKALNEIPDVPDPFAID